MELSATGASRRAPTTGCCERPTTYIRLAGDCSGLNLSVRDDYSQDLVVLGRARPTTRKRLAGAMSAVEAPKTSGSGRARFGNAGLAGPVCGGNSLGSCRRAPRTWVAVRGRT